MTGQAESILRLRWCPECDYCLAELPRVHACPECGFACDRTMFDLIRNPKPRPIAFRRPWLARGVLYFFVLMVLGYVAVLAWQLGIVIWILLRVALFSLLLVLVFMLGKWKVRNRPTDAVPFRVFVDQAGFSTVHRVNSILGDESIKRWKRPWTRYRSIDCRPTPGMKGCWDLSLRARRWRWLLSEKLRVQEDEPVVRAAVSGITQLISVASMSSSAGVHAKPQAAAG